MSSFLGSGVGAYIAERRAALRASYAMTLGAKKASVPLRPVESETVRPLERRAVHQPVPLPVLAALEQIKLPVAKPRRDWDEEYMRPDPVTGHLRATIASITAVVCAEFDISRSEIVSGRRHKSIVVPRQIAMYLCAKLTPRSTPQIGRRFGDRDHTTVLHAINRIEDLTSRDAALKACVDRLAARFIR